MKKVKITLGIALAMLLMGANGSLYGQSIATADFPVKVNVATVDSLLESVKISHGYTWRDKILPSYNPKIYDSVAYGTTPSKPTINASDLFNAAEKGYEFVSSSFKISRTDLGNCIKSDLGSSSTKQYGSYFVAFEINFPYKGGNERVPVVKRRLIIRDTIDKNGNPSVPIYVETTLYPTRLNDLIDFSTGTSNATYNYSDNIVAIVEQYNLKGVERYSGSEFEIEYFVSIVREYGEGGGYIEPTLTRFVEFETEGVELFQDAAAGVIYHESLKYGVESHKKFTFYAKASGKPIVETTADLHGDPIKISPIEGGLYEITIPSIVINQKITVTGPSVEEAGNQAIASETVWSAGGKLYVQGSGTLSIYSVAGQLLKQVTVSGSQTLTLGKGLYIVQLNGKAYKVIL